MRQQQQGAKMTPTCWQQRDAKMIPACWSLEVKDEHFSVTTHQNMNFHVEIRLLGENVFPETLVRYWFCNSKAFMFLSQD